MYCGLKFPKNQVGASVGRRPRPSNWNYTIIDWTSYNNDNYVTPVRDQGGCGSCWAFSAVAAIESMRIRNYNVVSDLSEQQLVDCDPYNSGCAGGWMPSAFNYIRTAGIAAEGDYIYSGVDGTCVSPLPTGSGPLFRIAGYTNVSGTCTAVNTALKLKPLSVAVQADSFQSYTSGVLTSCAGNLNHAVLLVGLVNKTVSTRTYQAWKIKNSWNTNWGEAGYVYVDVTNGTNPCSICNGGISYPYV